MNKTKPVILVCAFRRAECLRRVLKIATSVNLPVIVSIDSPPADDSDLRNETNNVFKVTQDFSLFDIWRWVFPRLEGKRRGF